MKITYTRGTGPGGQHKNKKHTKVVAKHLPTGIVVAIDGRNRNQNEKQALKELEKRVEELKQERKSAAKKERRDQKIHERKTVRTYNYVRGEVKDHRTGKTARLKEVMAGNLELLRE